MSVLCQNFVQNAWKQELCSNCYRAKNEHGLSHVNDVMSSRCLVLKSSFHSTSVAAASSSSTATATTTTTTTTTTWKGLALQNSLKLNGNCAPPLAGILKGGLRRRPPFQERYLGSVGFREEAPQVIGYGGGELAAAWDDECVDGNLKGKWTNGSEGVEGAEDDVDDEVDDNDNDEDDDDDDMICNGDGDSLENFDLSEEDREFARLTEKNTEFNSIPRNLVDKQKQQGEATEEKKGADQTRVIYSGAAVGNDETPDLVREPILDAVVEATAGATLIPVSHETDDPRGSSDLVTEKEPNPIILVSKEVVVVENRATDSVRLTHQRGELTASSTTESGQNSSGSDSPTADPTLVPPPDYMVNDTSDGGCLKASGTRVATTSVDEKNGLVTTSTEPSLSPPPQLHYSSSPVMKTAPGHPPSYPVAYCTSPVESIPKQSSSGKSKPKVPTKPNKLAISPAGEEVVSNGDVVSPMSPQDDKRQVESPSVTLPSSLDSPPPPVKAKLSEVNGSHETEEGTVASESAAEGEKRDLSFQAKVAVISTNLDLSKRNAKRQAPMPPPPHSPEMARPPRTARGKLVLPINGAHRPLQPWESDPGPRSNTPTPVSTPSPAQPQRPAPLSPTTEVVPRRSSCGLKTKSPSLESGIAFSRFPCIPTHDYVKDVKKFKNKFSLKKLLKFGKDGDNEGRGKGSTSGSQTNISERRTRIEILHPIDLANMAANSPQSGDDVINRDYPSDDSVFYETPMAKDQQSLSSLSSSSSSSSPPPPNSSHCVMGLSYLPRRTPSPPPPLPSLLPSNTVVDEAHPCPPPFPPPRTRTFTDGPRPLRPPPPQLSCMPVDVENRSRGQPLPSGDSRCHNSGEYANLGNVRTVLAPKKPERGSPASCRKETSQRDSVPEDGSPTNLTNHLYEFIPVNTVSPNNSRGTNVQQPSFDRTYYEPPDVEVPPAEKTSIVVNGRGNETERRWRKHVRSAGVTWVPVDEDSGDAGSESSGGDNPMVALPSPSIGTNPITALYAEVRKPKVSASENGVPEPPRAPPSPTDAISSSMSEEELPGNPQSMNDDWNHRLSVHGGRRSVLARGIHEHYNAVTAANHETLSQLLEQLLHSKTAGSGVYSGTNFKDGSSTLRWSDFTLETKDPSAVLEHVSFYDAIWNEESPVTLMVTDELLPGPLCTRNPFVLCPATTFQDLVPWSPSSMNLQRCRVAVLDRLHVQTLTEFIRDLRFQSISDIHVFEHGATALMLQLLSALKHLQAEGVEEVPQDDVWVLVHRGDPLKCAWSLMMLPLEPPATVPRTSLCECGVLILNLILHGVLDANPELDIPEVLPNRKVFQVVMEQLRTERATSLSKAKAVLEFLLWGPSEVQVNGDEPHEMALQHWLDLERALTLNNLIRSQRSVAVDLSPLEELHLLFVVRTTARTLKDAASLTATTASNA